MKVVSTLAIAAFVLPSYVLGQTAGTYKAYGSGCGVTGVKCGGHDPKSPGKVLRSTTLPNEYAYPFTLTATRPVTGAQFYCRSVNQQSNTVIARLYKALASGAPDPKALAVTLMTIGSKEQMWQCSWKKIQILKKGDYFVSYEPYLPKTSTPVLLTSQMTDGTVATKNKAHWRRPGSANFAPTSIVTHPWFEILCGGSPAPELTNTGVPTINKSFSIDMSNGGTGIAIGIVGFKKVTADLTVVAPGCYLFATPDLLLPKAAVAGKTSIKLPIPNDKKLIGASLFSLIDEMIFRFFVPFCRR